MFVAPDFRFQPKCDEPLIFGSKCSAPVLNVIILVPLLLIVVAAGAHQARLLRRRHEHSVDDIEGEKATPIDLDFKFFLLQHHDSLEDFGAAPVEHLHLVSDDGTIGFWLFWHVIPWGIWVLHWGTIGVSGLHYGFRWKLQLVEIPQKTCGILKANALTMQIVLKPILTLPSKTRIRKSKFN